MVDYTRYGKRMALLVVVGIATFLPGLRLFGQGAASASLKGTVKDRSAADVSEARVTLTAPDKGISRVFVTTNSGEYNFPLLAPGTYVIRVEKPGFATYVGSDLALGLGQLGGGRPRPVPGDEVLQVPLLGLDGRVRPLVV